MVGAVRADKQARAALHHFSKWYADAVENMTFGWYKCQLEDSPLSGVRKLTPHALLYFLVVLLQRLLLQYWEGTASRDAYVQHCVGTMHKCPGAIIGLQVYLNAPRLSPSAAVPCSPSRKQRMFASGSGRALARAPSVANSGSASRAEAESLEAAKWKPDVAAVTRSQIATCYAYTKVEQEARKKLRNIDWSWTSGAHDCEDILEAFSKYQGSNDFADRCLNLSAVVLELRLTVQFFSQERLWPGWLLLNSTASVLRIPEIHSTDVECGHAMLEVIASLINFAGAMETMRHESACSAARDAQDGEESWKWGAEDDNVWGNVLQRLLTALCKKRLHEQREDSVRRARRRLDIVQEMEEPPAW